MKCHTSTNIFVDDAFAIFDCSEDSEHFFKILNSLHPNLSFTKEAVDGSIPFIGIRITKNTSHGQTRLSTLVYHKGTDNGLYLYFCSYVDDKYKCSLIWIILDRTYNLCSNWNSIHSEFKYLSKVFKKVQYPGNIIQSLKKSVILNHILQ